MYYRNTDYLDLNRFDKALRSMPPPKPLTLLNRLVLAFGMIIAPVAVFFLVLGIGRLAGGP